MFRISKKRVSSYGNHRNTKLSSEKNLQRLCFFKKKKREFSWYRDKTYSYSSKKARLLYTFFELFFFYNFWFFWHLFTNIEADYVFCFGTSPITQALPGIWFSKEEKIPYYLYLQDLWPQSVAYVTGIKNNNILNIIGKFSDYVYKNCSNIFFLPKCLLMLF